MPPGSSQLEAMSLGWVEAPQGTTSQGQPGLGAVCGNQQGTENTEPVGILWMQVSLLGAAVAALHERVTWGHLQLLLSFLIFSGNPLPFHTLRYMTLFFTKPVPCTSLSVQNLYWSGRTFLKYITSTAMN